MELHDNTANSFMEYLKQHGYPEGSLALEWGDRNNRVDIAIIYPEMNVPVSIYEVKRRKDESTLSSPI